VSAAEAASRIDPGSAAAWSAYAHALARTDRSGECLRACAQALELSDDREVADLLNRLQQTAPRSLSERTAA
jgi:hypothetical protein